MSCVVKLPVALCVCVCCWTSSVVHAQSAMRDFSARLHAQYACDDPYTFSYILSIAPDNTDTSDTISQNNSNSQRYRLVWIHPHIGILTDKTHPTQRKALLFHKATLAAYGNIIELNSSGDASFIEEDQATFTIMLGSFVSPFFPSYIENAIANEQGKAILETDNQDNTTHLVLPHQGEEFVFDDDDLSLLEHTFRPNDTTVVQSVTQAFLPNSPFAARFPRIIHTTTTDTVSGLVIHEDTRTYDDLDPHARVDDSMWDWKTHARTLRNIQTGALYDHHGPIDSLPAGWAGKPLPRGRAKGVKIDTAVRKANQRDPAVLLAPTKRSPGKWLLGGGIVCILAGLGLMIRRQGLR